MISVYARWTPPSTDVRVCVEYDGSVAMASRSWSRSPDYHFQLGDLLYLRFVDAESARAAFVVSGRGTCMTVTDDEGVEHRGVDTLCGFSADREEMVLRPATWRG